MPYDDLRQFVSALEQAGELQRISAKVSPVLEISAIADRVSKQPCPNPSEHARTFDPHHFPGGGKALLFENVEGSNFPLLINAFGSYRRMEMALDCEEGGFARIAQRLGDLARPQPPSGVMAKIRKGLDLMKVASLAPKIVSSAPCQQVVKTGDQINLFELPIIKCWPNDGDPRKVGYDVSPEDAGTSSGEGRYITFAGIYTIHPDDADKPDGQPRPSRNVGMYRLQLIDRNHTAFHCHIHHDGARHWRAWKEKQETQGNAVPGKGMPCAAVFGGESVLPYAASAPMPPGMSELLLAGILQGRSIPLVKCKTIDLHVPANAEIVIEGYVSTQAKPPGMTSDEIRHAKDCLGPGAVLEGPFGDHTGFDSLPDRYPIFTVTAITHRQNPIYPTTIVGPPPQEDYYMGKATERIFLPLLQTLIPDIIDYDLPMFGSFHNCAFVKIRKEYPLQARRVMHAIWGAGQMAWTKLIVVVDHDVDVHDYEQVLFHLCSNFDPGRDVEIAQGPLDILDHAAPRLGAGGKMGLDGTRKIPGEAFAGHPVRDYPELLRMPAEIAALIEKRWPEYGIADI